MRLKMEFEEQIAGLELAIDTRPRVYLKWKNTEEGRDKTACYERITISETMVIYVNANNRNLTVTSGHPFFEKLEKMYQSLIKK